MENNHDTEIWKTLISNEYDISSFGRIKSLERFYYNALGTLMPLRERILKPTSNNLGYLRVSLNYGGGQQTAKIHRLVAITFIENPYNLPEVNHKDGNKSNNRVDNLEWCSRVQNIGHALEVGLIKTKITAFEVLQIRQQARDGVPLSDIAEEYAMSEGNVWNIVKYKTWKQVE